MLVVFFLLGMNIENQGFPIHFCPVFEIVESPDHCARRVATEEQSIVALHLLANHVQDAV